MLNENIDLTDATSSYAQFWARWDIEDEYDYVVFQASTDGDNWDNLCGERSKLGGVFQLYEEPLYDGRQTHWVLETSDLMTYLGQKVQLRFKMGTDGFVFKDGFYFDDFKVITIKEETTSSIEPDESAFSVYPNPTSNSFSISLPSVENSSLRIYNLLGTQVYHQNSLKGGIHEVNASMWPDGLYQYIIYSDSSPVQRGTVSLMH